jgi:hypothetical protein
MRRNKRLFALLALFRGYFVVINPADCSVASIVGSVHGIAISSLATLGSFGVLATVAHKFRIQYDNTVNRTLFEKLTRVDAWRGSSVTYVRMCQ